MIIQMKFENLVFAEVTIMMELQEIIFCLLKKKLLFETLTYDKSNSTVIMMKFVLYMIFFVPFNYFTFFHSSPFFTASYVSLLYISLLHNSDYSLPITISHYSPFHTALYFS